MRLSSNYKQQGTHMLNLIKAVGATTGDVCEVGCGFSSTPLLHWITLGRKMVTYESDPEWFNFARKFKSKNHKVRLANRGFTNVDYDRHWSVVFIDHSPKRPRKRGDDALKFKNADLIVLHDTEPESTDHYGYDKVFPHFKYRYDWTLCKPHCSIVSNTIDVTKWKEI
jgi:predicted O-methyltransferase YrrM